MLESAFLIFVLFQNIISKFLPSIFSYWDELLCLFLIVFFLIKTNGKIMKVDFQCFITLGIIIVIGILGNVFFGYQLIASAIIRDIIGAIKFPLVFISLYRLNITNKLTKKTIKLVPYIKKICFVILLFGILNIFLDLGMRQEEIRGFIHPYMFLYTHPTYLTTGMISILCILNAANEVKVRDDIVILSIVALAMRTKGLAFIAVYIFTKYGIRWVKKFKMLYWPAIAIIVFLVVRRKFLLYASFSNSPRESLYVGALSLMKQCFPIGSGFASFASHLSGKFFSQVYNIIYIAGLYDVTGQISVDIGDAGIPYYLGQFGLLGTLCFCFLFYKILKMSFMNLKAENRKIVCYVWLLIAISIPTEAILVNNGVELAFVLVIVYKLCKYREEN